MARWVLLLHELPDRSWHYDWMIQPAGPESTALVTFRTTTRPDDPAATWFPAERLRDHRAAYLTFEGELSGERGQVRRITQGAAEILRDDAAFVVRLSPDRVWVGRRRAFESSAYEFHLSSGPEFGHTDARQA